MKSIAKRAGLFAFVCLLLSHPGMPINQDGTIDQGGGGVGLKAQPIKPPDTQLMPKWPGKAPAIPKSAGKIPATPSDPSARTSSMRDGNLDVERGPNYIANNQSLESRIYALEAGRADLSAWATLFIGIVTVVLGANVIFSAAQASSLGRAEIAKIIKKYDRQFSGFISHNEEFVNDKLMEYEKAIADLSRRLDEVPSIVSAYSNETMSAINTFQQVVDSGIERLRQEAERLRSELHRNAGT